MSTSADSYQPFRRAAAAPQPPKHQPVSPACHQPVTASVTAPDGFADYGKGADFRRFQRDRAKSVTTVTAFSGRWPWGDGLDRLFAMPAPLVVSRARWDQLLFDSERFSRDWGDRAVEAGWSLLDLFGCHRDPRAARLDNNGLIIMLDGRRVIGLDGRAATIEAERGIPTRYYRGQLLTTSVPLWTGFSDESGP